MGLLDNHLVFFDFNQVKSSHGLSLPDKGAVDDGKAFFRNR